MFLQNNVTTSLPDLDKAKLFQSTMAPLPEILGSLAICDDFKSRQQRWRGFWEREFLEI